MTNVIGCEASAGEDAAGGIAPELRATLGARLSPILRAATRFLVDLLDRIAHGIRGMAPLMIGIGCQSSSDVVDVAPAVHEQAPAAAPEQPAETGPRPLGKFTITFYYVI